MNDRIKNIERHQAGQTGYVIVNRIKKTKPTLFTYIKSFFIKSKNYTIKK